MGWRMIKEYDINPLVEDSDDEKQLIRAESRIRKAKQQNMKKSQRRFTPYGRWSSTAVSTPPAHVREQSMFSDNRRPGLCFICRKSGHWKKDCPELERQNYIMRVVTEGYTLPLRELPPAKHMQNRYSKK